MPRSPSLGLMMLSARSLRLLKKGNGPRGLKLKLFSSSCGKHFCDTTGLTRKEISKTELYSKMERLSAAAPPRLGCWNVLRNGVWRMPAGACAARSSFLSVPAGDALDPGPSRAAEDVTDAAVALAPLSSPLAWLRFQKLVGRAYSLRRTAEGRLGGAPGEPERCRTRMLRRRRSPIPAFVAVRPDRPFPFVTRHVWTAQVETAFAEEDTRVSEPPCVTQRAGSRSGTPGGAARR